GAEVEVVGSAVLTVHRVKWTTLFERREGVGGGRPHDGGATPNVASTTPDNLDPWGGNMQTVGFAASRKGGAGARSESSRDCTACGSEGKLCCPSCNGQAAVGCPVCDGNGLVQCSNCLGCQRVENKVPQAGRRACYCVSGHGTRLRPLDDRGCSR